MKISVVMCTYNGEKYLEEQMDSLRLQTRQIDEVLICDDNSKDVTVALVETYIKRYGLRDNWQLYVNRENKGYADNFHDVMMKATGDLIFFSDQDDVWYQDKVEKMEAVFHENKDVLLLYTEHHDFLQGTEDNGWENKNQEDHTVKLEYRKIIFSNETMYLRGIGSGMAFRKNARDVFEKYWYSGWAHDEYMWKMALCYDGLYWSDECLMERRIHENNASLKKNHDYSKRVQLVEGLLKSYEVMRLCLKENNGDSDRIKITEAFIKASKLRLEVLKNKEFGSAVRLLLSYRKTLNRVRVVPTEAYLALKQKTRTH